MREVRKVRTIKLLDCTLRDGGHIVNSYFGAKVITGVIKSLQKANVDIIEAGFLQNCQYDENRAMFNNINEAKRILPEKSSESKYALMAQADLYDIDKLENNDGFIDFIRISFHDNHIEEGLKCCEEVKRKGYKCFINPINLMGYSDDNILKLIRRVNQIEPYAFTIVDTFGSLLKNDLQRLYLLLEHNLKPEISIGVHLHENQALSYSLAQDFIGMHSPMRNICIDGSLLGMGREPGNLCIELIMSFLNRMCGTHYDLNLVFDAIDEYIAPLKQRYSWGYSTAYALSARYHVHRSYAEYLMNKGRLKTKQIDQILSMIPIEKSTRFNLNYIEELYLHFQSNEIDDSIAIEALCKIFSGKNIILIGPGKSILDNEQKIKTFISEKKLLSITANFVWDKLKADYAFFTNVRRWDEFYSLNMQCKSIITSNLVSMGWKADYILNYSDLALSGEQIIDDCFLMLLRFIQKIGITNKVYLAGFDGFSQEDNFALDFMDDKSKLKIDCKVIRKILTKQFDDLDLEFITPTQYME